MPTHPRHIASDQGDVRSIQPNRRVSGTGLVRWSARANAPATSASRPGAPAGSTAFNTAEPAISYRARLKRRLNRVMGSTPTSSPPSHPVSTLGDVHGAATCRYQGITRVGAVRGRSPATTSRSHWGRSSPSSSRSEWTSTCSTPHLDGGADRLPGRPGKVPPRNPRFREARTDRPGPATGPTMGPCTSGTVRGSSSWSSVPCSPCGPSLRNGAGGPAAGHRPRGAPLPATAPGAAREGRRPGRRLPETRRSPASLRAGSRTPSAGTNSGTGRGANGPST